MSEELLFANALKSSKAFNLIKNDFSLGLGNAYLIISQDDEAVQSFFRLIACAVECDQHNSACLECDACLQVLHYNYPDVKFFNQEKTPIKADTMRFYLDESRKAPVVIKEGKEPHILIFIERLDLTTERVMNFLLKSLEEPPEHVSFFLSTANENGVLETIKSRCRKVYLDIFSDDVILEELKALNVPEEQSEIAVACADGQLGKARRIALSEDYNESYKLVVNLLTKMQKSSDIVFMSNIFDKYNRKSDSNIEILNIMGIMLRDVMIYKNNPSELRDGPIKEDIKKIAASFSASAAEHAILAVNDAKKKLYSPACNTQAIADSLLFSILEAKHLWR